MKRVSLYSSSRPKAGNEAGTLMTALGTHPAPWREMFRDPPGVATATIVALAGPSAVGLKATAIVVDWPQESNALAASQVKGPLVPAVTLMVIGTCPVFAMVTFRESPLPTGTVPKLTTLGVV